MTSELSKAIAKALADKRMLWPYGDGTHDSPYHMPTDEAAYIIDQHVAPLVEAAHRAKAYIDIKARNPQVAGEAWRDLCAAVDALEQLTPSEASHDK